MMKHFIKNKLGENSWILICYRKCKNVCLYLKRFRYIYIVRKYLRMGGVKSFVSSNCFAGRLYQDFDMEYTSPTVGLWFLPADYVEFCKKMGYKKIGLAFCRGLRKEARVVADLFTAQGFDVVSVICKTGGFPKESVGIPKEKKVNADAFEPMCNPIAQAEFLNSQETEFNIALGLCVGHDSMFYKYSKQMVTTLVAKDRVLAHNPCGAIYCAEGYFKKRLQ